MRFPSITTRHGRRILSPAPALALGFFVGSAHAATAAGGDETVVLLPFWVEAAASPAPDPAAPSFILARDARAGRATATLKDYLADAPGALLQESFGGFEPPRLSIRGSGLQSAPSSRGVAFLLDGFPLGSADGSFNSALVEPQFADRIELFRGDSAAIVAPAVLGGALNLPTGARMPVTLRAVGGSFGAAQALASGNISAGSILFSGAASFATQDGYRDHSAQRRDAFFARADYGAASVSLYRIRAAYDVPGPLTLAAATAAPRSISTVVSQDQPHRESDLTQAAIQLSQQSDALLLDGGVSWLHTNDWFRQLRANGIGDSRSDDITLHGALVRRFVSTAGENSFGFAATLTRGWRDFLRYRNDAGATGPLFAHDGLFATTASADCSAGVDFTKNFSFTAGVAALAADRDISPRLATNANSLRLHVTRLLPRARLTWSARPGLSFHASMARSAEPATFDDLLFVAGSYPDLTERRQSLATQRATTWELGTSGTHGSFGWDLTAYTADWRNEILRLADASGLPRGAVNASPTRHCGIEASGRWRIFAAPGSGLTLAATAAWNQFTFVDDPVYHSNRLAGAPPCQGSASLLYEHASGFFAAPAVEWLAGSTRVDHAGKLAYGGYALTHLRLGWQRNRAWTVFAEVKNILDRAHVASTAGVLDLARNPATTAIFLPGNGRALALGLEWQPR